MSNAFSLDKRDAMRLYNKLHMKYYRKFGSFVLEVIFTGLSFSGIAVLSKCNGICSW